jgi:hypothetical protein
MTSALRSGVFSPGNAHDLALFSGLVDPHASLGLLLRSPRLRRVRQVPGASGRGRPCAPADSAHRNRPFLALLVFELLE